MTVNRRLTVAVEERLRLRLPLLQVVARREADSIAAIIQAVVSTFAGGHRLFLFGNGGSAADAQHIAAEFIGRFRLERRSLPALALTADSSALTAIGNDYGFNRVFARQLEGLGQRGDLAVGLSTSGRSSNVLEAIQVAKRMGLRTVGLTGVAEGNPLVAAVDWAVSVPSRDIALIQECHMAVAHVICELSDDLIRTKATSAGALSRDLAPTVSLEVLSALRSTWRRDGMAVVWTNGCFDILHAGHVSSLCQAKRLGDVLVVGVNSDRSVRALKGAGRPFMPEHERAMLVGSQRSVDYVTIFDDLSPAEYLDILRPDIHCKGSDYAPVSGQVMPEADVVERYGGRIEFLTMRKGVSTTQVIQRLRRSLRE